MEKIFKTKLNKDDKNPKTTKATIDFTGVTREELETLAAATVVINQQAIYRISASIPPIDVIKVREQLDAPRAPRVMTPEAISAKASTLDKEHKLALIKQLQESLRAK